MRGPGHRGLPADLMPDELASSPAPECFARNRYLDRTHGAEVAKLLPGQYYVATRDMLLVTVLGSCVAACIRDVRLGIGGMNHFMLADTDSTDLASQSARYGAFAMEILINHILKLGGRRENLEAKVFGGGNVLPGLTHANIGHKNAAFVTSFLKTERIRVAAADLADERSRKVFYSPVTGKALVKYLQTHNRTIIEREEEYLRRLLQVPVDRGVDIFDAMPLRRRPTIVDGSP
jgi:chemotaxis protein CheD